MALNLNEIKIYMLNTYKLSFNKIFDEYYSQQINLEDCINKINRLNNSWNTSRVDIKNRGLQSNTIKFFEYGKHINVSYPYWFNGMDGQGCKFESFKKDIDVIFNCVNDGILEIHLKGKDFRLNDKRMDVYVNIHELVINNNTLFKGNMLVSHDKPQLFEKSCKNNEMILFNLNFSTIFDYFPQLKILWDNKNYINNIDSIYKSINDYISAEKSIIQNFEFY